ncbi:MAG: response regulator transcription factor [Acidobacteriota bacterium]
MKILIVEDSEQMRRMIASLIDDIAEEIIECSDGAEAVFAYHRHRPDWVLMDIEMREINGITATRQIIDSFPDARIVIVTNHDYPELRAAARRAGACAYMLKDNLLEIREILTGEWRCQTTNGAQ